MNHGRCARTEEKDFKKPPFHIFTFLDYSSPQVEYSTPSPEALFSTKARKIQAWTSPKNVAGLAKANGAEASRELKKGLLSLTENKKPPLLERLDENKQKLLLAAE
jgi:hypothetical protein